MYGKSSSFTGATLMIALLAQASVSVCLADEHEAPSDDAVELQAMREVADTPSGEGKTSTGLTGDWGGARTRLVERGVTLSLDVTQGVQGVMDGGYDEEAEYLGSSEAILDLDSEKMGLWPGGFGRVAAEGRWGGDVLSKVGSLSPVNNDAVFPADPDRTGKDVLALTELTATQFLAPWIGFYGGLVNTTGGDANEYAGFTRSNDHFQNVAFLASPVSFRTVPSITLGGGFVLIPFDWLVASFTFIDTEESPRAPIPSTRTTASPS
jgi:porin